MLGVIRHARHAQITKSQDLRKGLSSFADLLRVVTNPWIMLRLPCSFSWVLYGMPKVLRNNKLPISLEELSDFVNFLYVVICIWLDIHRNCKNMRSWAGNVRHGLSANQVNLKNCMRFHVDFFHVVR